MLSRDTCDCHRRPLPFSLYPERGFYLRSVLYPERGFCLCSVLGIWTCIRSAGLPAFGTVLGMPHIGMSTLRTVSLRFRPGFHFTRECPISLRRLRISNVQSLVLRTLIALPVGVCGVGSKVIPRRFSVREASCVHSCWPPCNQRTSSGS